MPSRQAPPLSPAPVVAAEHTVSHQSSRLLPPVVAGAAAFSLLLIIAVLYRKLTRSRTAPAPPLPEEGERENHQQQLRRFPFSLLRKATSSFSVSNRVGQGGFGSVYRGQLPTTGELVAVKLMESAGSIQGEREFHNELCLASRIIGSQSPPQSLVSILGFSIRGQRKLLVYELMVNGSLQDKLLDHKCAQLLIWGNRFKIILDIARALNYLHFNCGPNAVVHGDVKPSNVLLDDEFNAKLGDFGLAKILDENENDKKDEDSRVLLEVDDDCESSKVGIGDDNGSIVEETESVVTLDQSPAGSNFLPAEASPSEGFERASSLPESWVDKMSVESGGNNNNNNNVNAKIGKNKGGGSGRDYWWWKQDNGGNGIGSDSGRVKDYVMEWIGSEIKKERPTSSDLVGGPSISTSYNDGSKIEPLRKHKKKRWDWWASLDENIFGRKRDKSRKPREWWKEEFCDELTKKKKKKNKSGVQSSGGSELWWQRDEDFIAPERKKRRKSKSSFGSIDWWLDGLSGELRIGRRNSQDWTIGDIPRSGGISSTPSMRGTMCYIAPEYGGGAQLSEKCDVYSFGVLVLVIISGRRPLQVTASPMSEFERANLVSWARQLAYNGKLLELVDSSIQTLDKEQAMLCITIALLCIQRSPSKRPNMKEIVEMLTGDAEPPHLPFEFSPSPPSNFPFKSRKKGR